MFDMTTNIGELVIRATLVYAFLFLALRFGGKKHVGQSTPFDFVVLLILSETTQNALVGDDKSLLAGLISAATLLGIVHLVNYAGWRSKVARRFFSGSPKILVRHGQTRRDVLRREHISFDELIDALRRGGSTDIANVRAAILENDGKITVITRDTHRS
jgi:uncharacterized membrane protein YcaP (DUF421 family)